jgi:hypothetical protein
VSKDYKFVLIIVAAVGTMVVATALSRVSGVGWQSAGTPIHFAITATSGELLPSFFDGLAPNPELQKRLLVERNRPRTTRCQDSQRLVSRVANVLGIVSTVYAVGCGGECLGCNYYIDTTNCGTGCSGTYEFPEVHPGIERQGTRQTGAPSSTPQVGEPCDCDLQTCFNQNCPL